MSFVDDIGGERSILFLCPSGCDGHLVAGIVITIYRFSSLSAVIATSPLPSFSMALANVKSQIDNSQLSVNKIFAGLRSR